MLRDYTETIKKISNAIEEYLTPSCGSASLEARIDGLRRESEPAHDYTDACKIISMLESLPKYEFALLVGKYGAPDWKDGCAIETSNYMAKELRLDSTQTYDLATMYFSMKLISERAYADKHQLNDVHRFKTKIFETLDLWLENGLYKMERAINGLYNRTLFY